LLLDRHRNVLITDFGFANQFSSPQDDLMSTSCGSPCYAAPELVMNQGVYVGPAVDIWSCGVILFAMLCGYLPYDDDPANPESYNINLLYKYILNTPLIFPDYISEEACDLLSLMLVPDPEKRCTMETIMAHPWLSAHKHLFVNIENDQEIPAESTKRNTIHEEEKQTVSNNVIMEETTNNQEEEEEQQQQEAQQQQQQEEEAVVPEAQNDQEMKDVKQDDSIQQVPSQQAEPLPEETSSDKSKSTSNEKVLHFLSGQTNTPKPRNTNEKRTRHMSLAVEESTSILQAKFLSSIHQRKQQSTPETSPSPNSSASTPYPKPKRNVRLSTITPPTSTTTTITATSVTNERGTRRKTLSLLVNSMTDNKIPFTHRRQSNTRTPSHDDRVQMMPSVSEHTMNTLTDKEKHRSAGKKLMDWFKKKPLSKVLT
jgi:serine/threonine protein kinase